MYTVWEDKSVKFLRCPKDGWKGEQDFNILALLQYSTYLVL